MSCSRAHGPAFTQTPRAWRAFLWEQGSSQMWDKREGVTRGVMEMKHKEPGRRTQTRIIALELSFGREKVKNNIRSYLVMTELSFSPSALALLNIHTSLFLLGGCCTPGVVWSFLWFPAIIGSGVTWQELVLQCCLPRAREAPARECRAPCKSLQAGIFCYYFFNIPLEFETVSRNFFWKGNKPINYSIVFAERQKEYKIV